MRQHHPDRQQHNTPPTEVLRDIGGDNDDDGGNDHDHASIITHAYHTLRKPHTRAMYLLTLVGKPIDETSGAARLVGPEFLMTIMEWREMIDGIPSVADSGGGDQVMEELELRLDETREEMEGILAQLDVAFQDDDFDQAMKLVAQLQYWNRIEETIVEKL
jgi:molecular chaperone HscB